jgi:hypothetical protein
MKNVAYPRYIREKAIELRKERHLTLDQISERLAIPKTTVWYWIKDMPIPRTEKETAALLRRARDNSDRARLKREAAYAEGVAAFPKLSIEPCFKEFVVLYIAEGYKRNRNIVSICNSDPDVMAFATPWIRRFSRNPVRFSFQYHADQDPEALRAFWGPLIGAPPDEITTFRKSNSGQMRRRQWRCEYGVLSARAGDTYFRARLQAWIDLTKEGWLDSVPFGA